MVIKSVKKKWKILFGVTGTLALLWLIGTSTFLFDVQNTRFVAQNDNFGTTHCCLTGYAVAAHLAMKGAENIYARTHYTSGKSLSSISTPIHESINGIFMIDEYHYPPPFLILPSLLLIIFEDFFMLRTAWFILTAILFIGTLTYVAFWCGALRSQNRLLIFPIVLCAPTIHIAFQICNVHLLIIAISMLAMIAFEKKHPIFGGTLLGFAIVSKIWPIILVVYLLFQRRWKPVLWCTIAITGYILVGFFLFGPEPYKDFITHQLPHISNGESFSFMALYQKTIIENISIFGIPHKLYSLNILPSKPPLLSPILAWSFTILIGLIVILVSLRRINDNNGNNNNRLVKAQLWLALLTLVQLRSPFLPWHYGVVSTLWLIVLLAATVKGWKFSALLLVWLCLSVNIPIAFVSETEKLNLVYTLLTSLFIYGAIIASIIRYWKHSHGMLNGKVKHIQKIFCN